MLYRSSDSAREFTGWNQLPCGPVLTPNISCTKLKIHSAHADSPVQLFLNRILSWARNLDVGPVYASQIKKLRKRICRVEPAPLWASSYTHISCTKLKIHSAHADSPVFLYKSSVTDQSMLYRGENLERIESFFQMTIRETRFINLLPYCLSDSQRCCRICHLEEMVELMDGRNITSVVISS